MRTTIAAGLAALAVAPAAQAHDEGTAEHRNHWLRAEVVKLHGRRAPGCDLVALKCRAHPHPARRTVRRYLDTLRRQLMPAGAAAYVSSGRPWQPPAGAGTINAGPALENIAACESGGDPTAIGGGGKYRGKYQFDLQTWASVGGSGDPAAATEVEQDKRAAILKAQRGSNPWPECG